MVGIKLQKHNKIEGKKGKLYNYTYNIQCLWNHLKKYLCVMGDIFQ